MRELVIYLFALFFFRHYHIFVNVTGQIFGIHEVFPEDNSSDAGSMADVAESSI